MACVPPDGFEGGLGGLPRYTDNINVYVGKDATLGGAETEGLVFVEGDLNIDRQPGGLYNIGYVGVGSGIIPGDGELMLAVGAHPKSLSELRGHHTTWPAHPPMVSARWSVTFRKL